MQREMGSFAGGRGRVNEPKVLHVVGKKGVKKQKKKDHRWGFEWN